MLENAVKQRERKGAGGESWTIRCVYTHGSVWDVFF